MTSNQTVGSNIRALRSKRGITQEQFADAIGVSIYTVNNWERGKFGISFEKAVEIADYFRVPLDTLRADELIGKTPINHTETPA